MSRGYYRPAHCYSVGIQEHRALCIGRICQSWVISPISVRLISSYIIVNGWTDGFAFVLSLLAPVWTIGTPELLQLQQYSMIYRTLCRRCVRFHCSHK